jgi:hypothetical protein
VKDRKVKTKQINFHRKKNLQVRPVPPGEAATAPARLPAEPRIREPGGGGGCSDHNSRNFCLRQS